MSAACVGMLPNHTNNGHHSQYYVPLRHATPAVDINNNGYAGVGASSSSYYSYSDDEYESGEALQHPPHSHAAPPHSSPNKRTAHDAWGAMDDAAAHEQHSKRRTASSGTGGSVRTLSPTNRGRLVQRAAAVLDDDDVSASVGHGDEADASSHSTQPPYAPPRQPVSLMSVRARERVILALETMNPSFKNHMARFSRMWRDRKDRFLEACSARAQEGVEGPVVGMGGARTKLSTEVERRFRRGMFMPELETWLPVCTMAGGDPLRQVRNLEQKALRLMETSASRTEYVTPDVLVMNVLDMALATEFAPELDIPPHTHDTRVQECRRLLAAWWSEATPGCASARRALLEAQVRCNQQLGQLSKSNGEVHKLVNALMNGADVASVTFEAVANGAELQCPLTYRKSGDNVPFFKVIVNHGEHEFIYADTATVFIQLFLFCRDLTSRLERVMERGYCTHVHKSQPERRREDPQHLTDLATFYLDHSNEAPIHFAYDVAQRANLLLSMLFIMLQEMISESETQDMMNKFHF